VDDDVLITGDLNSYAKEDPIQVFLDAGYVDLHSHFEGDDAYGYVFDGQWGYLDHALASPSLFEQVTGAASYHINADEPSVLDYNHDFKSPGQLVSLYAPDEFRTSDHDPVVVRIGLAAPLPAWSPTEVYDTGDRVTHDGKVWEALWWTRNQEPGNPYGPWMEIAETEAGIPIWTPSRIFDGGDRVIRAASRGEADAYGSGLDRVETADGLATWTPTGVYDTGDRVMHDGKVWEALWWTRNEEPGDPYGPWMEIAETESGIPIWTPSRIFDGGDI